MEFGKYIVDRFERMFQNFKTNNSNNSLNANRDTNNVPTTTTCTSSTIMTAHYPTNSFNGVDHNTPVYHSNSVGYQAHSSQQQQHHNQHHNNNPPSSLSLSSPSSSAATVSPSPSSCNSNSQHQYQVSSPAPPSSSSHHVLQNSSHPFLVNSSSQPSMPNQNMSHYPNCNSSNTFFQHTGSYSVIQTPDSPIGFPRRQHSLNVNQRQSSRLQLNLKSQKSSPAFGKTSSTELIDTHSLSPRPRPKNLGLSNSHENMSKQFVTPPGSHNMSSRSQKPNFFPFNTPQTNVAPNRSQNNNFYQFPLNNQRLKSDFSLDKPVMTIDGIKYEKIRESDFKKISELGSGSFGQVERMLHLPSKTELAVKKMRRSGSQDHNKHILNDLRLLITCNYPNIVRCYGYNVMETEVWIFMELMTTCFGRLLGKLKSPIPESIMGKITVSTIDTLNYLKKEQNMIHRDIKPSNILINNQGVIKLCDFGISGLLIDSKAHSRSVGCTAYMAPERIEPPDSGTYDIRSDVWSLGITLVEIATGKYPYEGWSSDFELLSRVIQEDPPSLPTDGRYSIEFCSFIKACLTKQYLDRPKYIDLMKYPFYEKSRDAKVDVAEWFRQAYYE